MTSMLRILLLQQKQHQNEQKVTNTQDQVITLVYRLLQGQKIQLLQQIFVNLKKQQEKFLQKQGLVKKVKMQELSGKILISYSQLLSRLRLQDVVHNDESNKLVVIQNDINKNNNDNTNRLIKIINFFVDYVFVQRRITESQIIVLEKTIHYLRKFNNQQQTLTIQSEQQQKLIQKCQLLIELAKQNLRQQEQISNINNKNNNNIKVNNKEQQQQYTTALQHLNIQQQLKKHQNKLLQQQYLTNNNNQHHITSKFITNNDHILLVNNNLLLQESNRQSNNKTLIELYNNLMNQIQSIIMMVKNKQDQSPLKKESSNKQQQLQQQTHQQKQQQYISINNQTMSKMKMNLLPQLLQLINNKNNVIEQLNQQAIQLMELIQSLILKIKEYQHMNSNRQHQKEKEQQFQFNLNKQLAYWNKYWFTVLFVQQFLQLLCYKYQQLLSVQSNNKKKQQQQQQNVIGTNVDSLMILQGTLIQIGQVYQQILSNIYTEFLQQGLQNDLKNNMYLSQQKLLTHYINLSTMSNLWLYSYNNTIQNSKIQQQIQFQRTKRFSIPIEVDVKLRQKNNNNNNKNKAVYSMLKRINQKIIKIINFFSYQKQGIQSRLLSNQEYEQKVGKVLDQYKIESDERVFMRWFVYEYQWYKSYNVGEQNSSSSQQQGNKQSQHQKQEYKKLFLQTTYPKLQHILCHHLQQSTLQQPLNQQIKTILGIKLTTLKSVQKKFCVPQQNESFSQDLFEFYSPTFNNQYLTFNYIYGEMKDIYFYQNHHFSHVLLIVYQLLIKEFTKQLKKSMAFQQSEEDISNTNEQYQQQQQNSDNNNNNNQNNKKFYTRMIQKQNYANFQLAQQLFNKLRNHLGRYAKDHLLQANSKQFYQYLNLFKFCYITFNKTILNLIELDELILTFDLFLNQIIVKQNHPLIRQYIEVIMARVYFVIKQKCIKEKMIEKFCQCRNRMINMLDYDQENVHNLNIGVPILMLLGYQLISYIEGNNKEVVEKASQINKQNNMGGQLKQGQQKQIEDEFGSKQIKPQHELDIHYILVKYISCHVAYMRTICQYYMSKYIKLMKDQNKDVLLSNLVNFWHSDKDSVKIMTNIAIAIEGFKNQMNIFNTSQAINESFYMCFERVEEQPKIHAQYFLAIDTIEMLQRLSNTSGLSNNYELKVLFAEKILVLKSQVKELRGKMVESLVPNKEIKSQPKKVQKPKENNKKVKPSKQDKKGTTKQLLKQKLQQKQKAIKQQSQQKIELNQQQLQKKLNQNLRKSYLSYQKTNQPNVIIIATLLQKVHNFGYLVRTLTSHNAMLTVPSSQPFTHPECKELLPKQDEIDVKVIEVKQKNLESFIRMYQQRGYPLIALQQCSKSITLQKTVFPQKYMLLLGNQRIGAPASLLNMADILVQIPQIGKVRSLNVHVSMVICFWEYLKQQKEKKNKKLQNKNQKNK